MFGLSSASKVKRLETEKNIALLRVSDLVGRNGSLEDLLKAKDQMLADKERMIKSLEDETCEVKERFSELCRMKDELDGQIAAARNACEELRRRNEDLDSEVCNLRSHDYVTPDYKTALAAILSDDKLPVFISGPAGTGKSTLIRLACELFRAAHPTRAIQVVAPTGIAAENIGGRTIHSFFKFAPEWRPRTGYSAEDPVDKDAIATIRRTDVLIIDEVSMLSASILDAVNEALQVLMERRGEPFGGTKVIFVGDMGQLPPVIANEDRVQNMREYGRVKPYFFDAHVLNLFRARLMSSWKDHGGKVNLNTVFRQNDADLRVALLKMRQGAMALSDDQVHKIGKRYTPNPPSPHERTTLVTTNAAADALNRVGLNALVGKLRVYDSMVRGNVTAQQVRDSRLPARIELKTGARVMLLQNHLPEYCNGTIGVVAAMGDQVINVRVRSGGIVVVERTTVTFKENRLNAETGLIEHVEVGSITQFPLKLAWGLTIHKGQGQTLDDVYVDLDNVFATGQTYTALSRVRNLQGVHLVRRFDRGQILSDPSVVDWL